MLIFTIFGLLLFQTALAADKPCGDWEPYKDEKCYKITDKLMTFAEAEKFCAQNDSHLIAITFHEEQAFLTDLLFKKHKVLDNVWIGAKYTPENKFQWEDGSKLIYTNWKTGRPKNSATDFCVQMDSDSESLGKWVDEPCGKKNLVVCQKQQLWSMARVQKTLMEVKLNPVPIGFIYVQLPKEKAPQEIWPWMVWSDVSGDYDGAFFRAASGSAASFGSVQEDNAPRIVEAHVKFYKQLNSSEYAPDHYNSKVQKGSKSSWLITGADSGIGIFTQFTASGGEVRPQNMAMRIWKRTA